MFLGDIVAQGIIHRSVQRNGRNQAIANGEPDAHSSAPHCKLNLMEAGRVALLGALWRAPNQILWYKLVDAQWPGHVLVVAPLHERYPKIKRSPGDVVEDANH